MKNKTLRRAFRKYLDVSDVEELRGLLAELEKGFTAYQASGATRAFVENFMEFIENLDSAMEDLDRVIEIRDRSLAVSSRELTSLNRQITEQAVKQKAVLEELKRTVHVLQPSSSIKGEGVDEHSQLENLVKLVSDLVSDHLQRAAKLQMLFEEGTKIAGASSYSSLERQMSSTISRLRGEKVDVKIYYSESLFSGKNSSAFYLSLEGNQPDFSKQLTVDSGNKSNEYIYINSTRGEGVAAVMELPVPPGYDNVKLKNELTLLKILEPNIATTIENIRLLLEERVKQHLENELRTARLVQQTLLPPAKALREDRFEICGDFESAAECGGDWWSYFKLENGRYVIFIGDVTGHGTASAMVSAVVKGYCDSFALHGRADVGGMLNELNKVVYRVSREGSRVMTMTAVFVDTTTGRGRIANAGHPHPYLISGGQVKVLVCSGPMLGLNENVQVEEKEFSFSSGDRLFLYSDGLSECLNQNDEIYSEKRIRRLLSGIGNMSSGDIIKMIKRDLQSFRVGAALQDDVTAVAVSFL